MIRAVVFDVGGVLEITPATGWVQRWCSELALTDAEFGRRLDGLARQGALGHITLAEYTAHVQAGLGIDAAQAATMMADLWHEYLGSPNTELIAYFASLRGRVRTGILSNSFVGARERERERYGFEDLCDVVVYSHEEGMMKPAPDFYRTVCDRLDVAPEEVVFLDDMEICVEGAREVGMTAVRYRDNAQAISEIERHLMTAGV